jgi:hypothetical protein
LKAWEKKNASKTEIRGFFGFKKASDSLSAPLSTLIKPTRVNDPNSMIPTASPALLRFK